MRAFALGLVLTFGFVNLGCRQSRTTPTGTTSSRAAENVDFPVGTFSLTERDGRTVTDADLRGKVWVASFIFTHCPGPCKEVTATVAQLQKELADEPNVRFVTVSIDPKRDTPATLKAYASMVGADAAKWLFLTGEESAIHTLMEKQFKQGHGEKPGPSVKPGSEFAKHSTKLSVVDKHGVIRGIYDGIRNSRLPAEESEAEHRATLERLKAKVRQLNQEA